MTTRRALLALIVVSGSLRLAWAASFGPGNDEAYHYLFTVHRDWSYFDHPPMLAMVEVLGVALCGGLVNSLSLRLGFILLFAGSTWMMARLGGRLYGPRAGLLAAFALNVTAYHTAAAGAFALPDGPLLFFWLLTLDRLVSALGLDGRAKAGNAVWLGVGLAWGCAMLSKYHAIFLPAGALLYVLLEPSARRVLKTWGPYAAAGVGLAAFAPVIGWNATHGWASFAFQAGRAVGGFRLRPETLLAALFLPALYLFPWVWARLIGVLWTRGRGVLVERSAGRADRFLLCQSVLPMGTFLAVACTREVLPHWTLVGFLPLFPMLGQDWDVEEAAAPSTFRRRAWVLATLPVLFALGVTFQARTGFFQKGRPGGIGVVKASADPTADTVGWDVVARELKARGLLDRPGTFLFTGNWFQSGQLAYATRNSRTPVLCYHAGDARSFAFWSRPEEWVGRDGILVALNESPGEPARYSRWFTKIEPLGSFAIDRAGAPVRTIWLYRCERQTSPFPFDDLGRKARARKAADAGQVASARP